MTAKAKPQRYSKKAVRKSPGMPDASLARHMWEGVSSSAMDFQNSHQTIWCGFGNPWKRKPYLDGNAPKEYFNGVKYGSPSGLMQIMR